MKRNVTALGAVIAVLLTTAGSTAVGRTFLQPRTDGPQSVRAIEPSYVLLPVADAPAPAKPQVAKPKPQAPAQPKAQTRVVCPTLPSVTAAPATGARAVVARVKIYDAPDGRVLRTLDSPTIEGAPLNTLVHQKSGMWLRVQVPVRPNHAMGWVLATDFQQYQVDHRVVVQRCAKRITVFRNGVEIWSKPAAVGKAGTPTPLGSFFVDFVAPMRYGSAYGPYLVSVAGFSNVLHQFGKDGIGQIAIHGTNNPSSVGKAASNGCIRLYNSDLVDLVKLLPEGSPVTIVE